MIGGLGMIERTYADAEERHKELYEILANPSKDIVKYLATMERMRVFTQEIKQYNKLPFYKKWFKTKPIL